jgi:hypothetical protein
MERSGDGECSSGGGTWGASAAVATMPGHGREAGGGWFVRGGLRGVGPTDRGWRRDALYRGDEEGFLVYGEKREDYRG